VIEGTTVVHEARYRHSVERVWRALTDQAELAAWLMPNNFEPVEGRSFWLDANPDFGRMDCEVLTVEPPRRLRCRWTIQGDPTTVTFDLTADGDETVLRVEHEAIPDAKRPSFEDGWPEKFDDLRGVLG
jgi:uncharacterized protein YndB with AHSA1/START domain